MAVMAFHRFTGRWDPGSLFPASFLRRNHFTPMMTPAPPPASVPPVVCAIVYRWPMFSTRPTKNMWAAPGPLRCRRPSDSGRHESLALPRDASSCRLSSTYRWFCLRPGWDTINHSWWTGNQPVSPACLLFQQPPENATFVEWIRSPENVPKWYRALARTRASWMVLFFLRSVNRYHPTLSRSVSQSVGAM